VALSSVRKIVTMPELVDDEAPAVELAPA